jgi:hypothetical protein
MGFTGSSGTCTTLRPCFLSRAAGLAVAEATGPAVRCARALQRGVPPKRDERRSRDPRLAARTAEGLRGERDVRSTSWLAGPDHCPPRPSGPARAVPRGPRGSADRAARTPVKVNVRAPHDLGAVSPDCCLVRAARHRCRASSPGDFQRPPLHRYSRGVHSGPGIAAGPSGRGDQPRPRSALVVSHHLDGFLLLDLAGLLHPAADHGVHRVSARRETCFLAMHSCPPKPCSPPAATTTRLHEVTLDPSRFRVRAADEVSLACATSGAVGPRHRPRSFEPVRSPRALALLAFPSPAATTVARRSYPESRASRALLRRRVRCLLRRFQRCGPDAPMGLAEVPGRIRSPTACAARARLHAPSPEGAVAAVDASHTWFRRVDHAAACSKHQQERQRTLESVPSVRPPGR